MIGDNPGSLRMLLYVPTNLPPMSPLVVTLHGGAQNANDYAIGAGWLTLAARFGFAVLCPQQSFCNNAPPTSREREEKLIPFTRW